MNGYIINMTPNWAHALKREIGPGHEIPLDDLYNEYGKKHNLAEGKEFVTWLRNVKLKDTTKWKIVFSEDIKEVDKNEKNVSPSVISEEVKTKADVRNTEVRSPLVETKLEVSDIVELSVRKARDILPTVRDLNLLRYSLSEANQRANKDVLCNLLRKRIKELEISR